MLKVISPYCKPCGKAFHSEQQMKIHNAELHQNQELQFSCDWCEKSFQLRGQLFKHITQEHAEKAGQSIFRCKQCEKTFLHRSHLKEHVENVHLAIKYTCEICQKSFKRFRNLKAHKKAAHKDISEILILNPRSISTHEFQCNGME